MHDTQAAGEEPSGYEIRIQGHLDPRWAVQFDGMALTTHDDGTTSLTGFVVDQAALHGLLARLRDTGIPLVSITQSDTGAQTGPVRPGLPSPSGPNPSQGD